MLTSVFVMNDIRQDKAKFKLRLASLTLGGAILIALSAWSQQLAAPSADDALLRHVKQLASNEFAGRGVGTAGIDLASAYIAEQFAKLGLKPAGDADGYRQNFEVAVGVTIKEPTLLALDDRAPLARNEDWTPLSFSTSDKVVAEMVFAGYGITDKESGYDDYAGLDVKNKIVLVLRYEPPPKSAKSPFRNAPDYSNHSALRTKANNARDHGAAGLILVDLNQRGEDKTELITTLGSLARGGGSLVAAQIKRHVIEAWLERRGVSLAALKEKIDREEKPASQPIADSTIQLQVTLQENRARADNVVGFLPGADDELKDQVIVIGAHYDHLGTGEFGARNAGAAGEIHHGADDNASGTALLLDLARRLSQLPVRPARTIYFAAFSAEELGLYGSRHFVERFPAIGAIKAMINLDMVGRLRDNRLTVSGARSGEKLSEIVTGAGRTLGFAIGESDDVGRSDHMSFYNKKIAVLHFTTGVHPDYHRPSDTWEKIDIDGMARVGDLALATTLSVANAKEPMRFVSLPSRPPSERGDDRRGISVYLGTMPDYGANSAGLRLAGVASDSPAARAGLREGDVIVKLAEAKIQNIEDLTAALRNQKPDDEVAIVVLRGESTLTLKAILRERG
ncbi:MAG: M20/M25/M40 family metallo-hydrolase [Deltaproteobacteria bacterium]|nr:M20/M25/M40 family metallo-hydrolase [Deltaproteobacteria bacterium]